MLWKHFACVAVSSAIFAAPVGAAPSLSFVDNLNGTVTLQITPSGTGSIDAEIAVTADFDLTSAVLADAATFDTANPGDNPLTGTVTNGLWLDLENDQLFASFGTTVLDSTAAIDFLTIGYTGFGGLISASGLVAEGGANYTDLWAGIEFFVDPLFCCDYDNSGQIAQGDLDLVLLNWGGITPPIPAGWVNDLPAGQIGQAELDGVLLNWGNGPAVAVPEPSTALLVLLGTVSMFVSSSNR